MQVVERVDLLLSKSHLIYRSDQFVLLAQTLCYSISSAVFDLELVCFFVTILLFIVLPSQHNVKQQKMVCP